MFIINMYPLRNALIICPNFWTKGTLISRKRIGKSESALGLMLEHNFVKEIGILDPLFQK